MNVSLRYDKGLGNAALRLRAVDPVGALTDLGFLTEYPDADPVESNYLATVSPPVGWVVIQFIRVADGRVVAEETPVVGVPSGDIESEVSSFMWSEAEVGVGSMVESDVALGGAIESEVM